jgi:superoxide dismutase, Cu-Zn family
MGRCGGHASQDNEIWLDFTTDHFGNAMSMAHVDRQFTDQHAGFVVIHDTHTQADPGHAGTAGHCLACFSAAS